VVVGDDTLWLSFTCFTDWSEDSFGDRPRLYETVVQGGGGKGWVEDMAHKLLGSGGNEYFAPPPPLMFLDLTFPLI
jgi:hypothetical protein